MTSFVTAITAWRGFYRNEIKRLVLDIIQPAIRVKKTNRYLPRPSPFVSALPL